ncbi:MAG: 3-hydroxyacyl-CoA dehydrogenase/enoyl-CoA hydratase family protein [Kofleriaceae bacterium]|nr:3-hydroxyacyl-CoA dehydrogenase/enoyl-CoA hydratase family protein [Kofleriaceae bacterium]MBP9172362.1 3-hydroxyacyl-CoA dehydrogenase/enoyl-CoA hydratase family protein [Kofleriaceae bacterium]MBP9862738.1 3-hydroxyacyl-CoA dehydrogenase/enoyl-CoA hydratase family protein [Kofleriaceae bacterium]
MSKPIRKVAVLGSGVMGSGIAAHLANAGLPVLLLDIVPPKLDAGAPKAARDAIAAGALDKLKKARPAAFSHGRNVALISIGNLEDDLAKVAECDLIVEAIIERLDIKRALFTKLDALLTGDTIVASNTSGLRIAEMLEGRSDRFRQHFLVTHFFNPPRYMKLLELVAGPDTAEAVKARATRWGKDQLGKGIVWAKDTPNFVANRIGTHAMMASIHLMLAKGLAPEDLDNLTGAPMGHPKSASFRTADLVGLDTLAHVVDNCYRSLTEDEDREVFTLPAYVKTMVERGQLGDKTKGGFYKKAGKDVATLDPTTGEYRAKGGDEAIAKACKGLGKIEDVRERVKKLVATPGVVGEFAWQALSKSLAYSARRLGEICDDVTAIDDGMKWGYNWDLGPFETWDALGFAETAARMKAEGIALPAWVDQMVAAGATGFYKGGEIWSHTAGAYVARATDPREVSLTNLRRGDAPVLKNNGAEAWDLGDGVLGLTFKTKANSIDADVIRMLHEATAKAEAEFAGMLIYNTGEFFCVGANLFAVVMAAQQKQWDGLREMIHGYQYATQRMKYATVPVVAAPYNMTLGGGLELCYGCDSVQAALETYSGLVEVGVGLIPGGAGTLNMLWRALEAVPEGVEIDTQAFVVQTFKNIALAKVATSAEEAKAFGFFRPTDGVSFDRARQLHEAKQRVIGLATAGYHPPIPRSYKLPGESGIATLQMMVNTLMAGGYASEHDGKIAMKLANVLCGGAAGGAGPVGEDRMLELEREAFLSLCGEPKSQERMQFMLMNNKPLRN